MSKCTWFCYHVLGFNLDDLAEKVLGMDVQQWSDDTLRNPGLSRGMEERRPEQ